MTTHAPPPQTVSPEIEQTLQLAAAQHQAGQLAEAKRLYLSILKVHPDHPVVNHNMGVLSVQSQQPSAALEYFMAALAANPAHGQYWLSYIDALLHADQLETAREVLTLARQQGLQGAEVEALTLHLQKQISASDTNKPTPEVSATASHHGKKPPKSKPAKPSHSTRGISPRADEINALVTLFNAGRLSEVVRLAKTMTEHYPQHEFGWKALGTALQQMSNNADALLPLQKAAALAPHDAQTLSNLGITLQDLGQLDEAEASLRKAVYIDPDFADAYCNLGSVLQDKGLMNESESCFHRALQIKPNLTEAHYNLANMLMALGRLGEAEMSYRSALQISPDHAQAHSNLGVLLNDLGRQNEAIASLQQALQIKPDLTEGHNNLGKTLQEMGHLNEAEVHYKRALLLKPDSAEIHNNLGNHLQDLGRLDEAETYYRRAIEINPGYTQAHSNLLFLHNYTPDIDPAFAFAEAREYGKKVTNKVTSRFTSWPVEKQPERLRIGFVSGDFKNHPVGYFLENLLAHLDQTAVELIAYPTDHKTDELTARIQLHFSAWQPLYGLSDEAAARQIHSDGIHVLIDLSGHTRHNRLPLFAWKPAPVQVAWLGYFATTGVTEIDYLIADPWTLPESEEVFFTERIWRLPETRLCFTPPTTDLKVSPLPALTNSYVTFGCFNNLTKMNDDVVALWSRVLISVPGSRLYLKSKQLMEASVRQHTIERFAAHGIDADRLILEGAESREKYLTAYNRVDISLDPFPYPGGTTSVESLWMGVPVLNLSGKCFLFRQGVGFLMNAGLQEWIASDKEDYLRRATRHALNFQHLADLRNSLRQQVLASPIMDGQRFARHFEAALRGMWQRWCGQ